jgi:hypothetical protein
MPNMRPVVMVFGRFNPPTIGHEALIQYVQSIAHRVGGDVRVYSSQTQDARKNPLPFRNKVRFLRSFFPSVTISDNLSVRTPIDALAEVAALGYTDVILVAGSDRVENFEKLGVYLVPRNSPKYDATKHIPINHYRVMGVPGDRDPDAEGVAGMSASKMRKLAAANDYASFAQGVPRHVPRQVAKDLFKQVRQYMGIHEKFQITEGQFKVGVFEANTPTCVECGSRLSSKEQKKASATCDWCDLDHRNKLDKRRAYESHDILKPGTTVRVSYKGHRATGKVVRYDKGDGPHGTPYYVVDVGGQHHDPHAMHRSEKFPVHAVVKEDHIKVGDKVHAGLAQQGGAGFSGHVDKIEGTYVYVNIGKDKFGDRIIKAPMKNVMKESANDHSFSATAIENNKVVDHMWDLAKHEFRDAVAMFRQKHPHATISFENKSGKVVKVVKAGQQFNEEDTPAATKPPSETERLRSTQQQELIALKTRQANAMMAAKLRDVQMKAREAQLKTTQPKPAAKPAS